MLVLSVCLQAAWFRCEGQGRKIFFFIKISR